MKTRTIGLSSLFLGTVLATGWVGVRAEETLDAAAAGVARRTPPADDADAIRFYTGSIRALEAPTTGGLRAPGAPLGSLKELPPPADEHPAVAKPAGRSAAPVASTAAPAPAAATPAVTAPDVSAPSATIASAPAEPVGESRPAIGEPSAPAAAAPAEPAAPVATAPAPEAKPEAAPAVAATPAPDVKPEAAPAVATTPAEPKPETAAAPAEAPAVPAAAVEAPAAPAVAATPAESAPTEAKPEPAPAVVEQSPAAAPASAEAKPVEPAAPVAEVKPSEPVAPAVVETKPVEPVAPVAAVAPTAPGSAAPVAEAKPETTAVAAPPTSSPLDPASTASVAPAAAETPVSPVATVAPPAPATAAAPAAAEAPVVAAATVDPAIEVADRAALTAALDARRASADDRADRTELAAFYESRAGAYLFVDASGPSPVGKAVAARLAASAEDGLEPRDYPLPTVSSGAPEIRARAEVATALAAVRYARHLQSGRFAPGRVSDLVTPRPPKTSAAEVLDRLALAADPDAVLASYAPPHVGYAKLKKVLADLRAASVAVPTVRLPVGPILKPGQKNERVALLRERLGVSAIASDGDLYDTTLAEAVKAFQRDRGIPANGAVGRDTVVALNDPTGGNADRIADVIVNMERWRWLPRDLGRLHVFVNVPDFRLDVMKDGRSIHRAKVITGRPENQTPIFSEMMQYVVVNPYWNVPISIIRKEMLGKAQETAGQALTRGNYEVAIGNRTVDPTTVDWSQVPAEKVEIRQRPGDGNALGNIKFMFPNQHSVYIHDTSSRGLFAQSYRALSHGCVRVQEPFSFADAVLSEEPEAIDGAKLKAMLGKGEKQVSLKRQVPVHITYFTDFVGDDGRLETRRDIYGHDARMKRLLGL